MSWWGNPDLSLDRALGEILWERGAEADFSVDAR